MTYRSQVKNGVVTVEVPLPEGAVVDVSVEVASNPDEAQSTIWDRLRKFAGTAEGLPPDMAKNHDYYRRQQVIDRHEGLSDPADDELTELLLRHAGVGQDLPSDLAANHDHYAHGKPKL